MSRTSKVNQARNAYADAMQQAVAKGVPQVRTVTSLERGYREIQTTPLLIRTTPVMFGVPMDELLYSKFFTVFFRHLNIMPWDGFATTESTYLPDARNEIHRAFVEDSDLPYLMMLDSDILCPPNIVERLIAHQLPIVGGWYKNKNQRMAAHPIVYDFVNESADGYNFRHRTERGQGLERVDGMGAGCWLMSREVSQALGPRPYSMHKATEDLNLCKKLIDLNIPLHVDWSLECGHVGVSYV